MSKTINLVLTEAEAKVYVDMLERVYDEFGNHGCNDYSLADDAGLSPEEQTVWYDVYDQLIAPRNGNELSRRNGSESDFMTFVMLQQRIETALKETENE